MAIKKKQAPVQHLSPENYIRQKARKLPIFECLINKHWEEEKLANIVIARSHTNGNITLCFYLVDLGCLGVKDTFYRFNIDLEEYHEILDKYLGPLLMVKIPYELAHNIIYGAVEYAGDYGFHPCKDYTSVTRYMLEDDTDDIELIELDFGNVDGNPVYVNTGFDSKARVQQILNLLEKNAGEGNFTYIGMAEEDDDSDPDFAFSKHMLANMKEEFMSLMNKGLDNLSDTETNRMITLAEQIYPEITNESKVYDYVDHWDDELNMSITDENTNEFVGVSEEVIITSKQYELINEILFLLNDNHKKAAKKIMDLEKQIGATSLVAMMQLKLLKQTSPEEYSRKLETYSHIYPDYPMIKLMNHFEKYHCNPEVDLDEFLPKVDNIFKGRNTVTEYEITSFLTEKLFLVAIRNDVNLIEAYFMYLNDIDLDDEIIESLKSMTLLVRIGVLKNYFENQ